MRLALLVIGIEDWLDLALKAQQGIRELLDFGSRLFYLVAKFTDGVFHCTYAIIRQYAMTPDTQICVEMPHIDL
jgi:hypothetical protein